MATPKRTPIEKSAIKGIIRIERKWDGRIRSARELFRVLHDFLDRYGYHHEYHELIEKPGAIEGTATFWDELTGNKDYSERKKGLFFSGLGLLLVGLIVLAAGAMNNASQAMAAGGILFVIGLILMIMSKTALRRYVKLHIEGETYLARGKQQGMISSEVLDVASNCRVVFIAKVGSPQKGTSDVSKVTTNRQEWDAMQEEFNSLVADFERLLPKIELPRAQ